MASSSRPKVNLRSTAVKRIMQEASELADPQEDDFVAAPLEVRSTHTADAHIRRTSLNGTALCEVSPAASMKEVSVHTSPTNCRAVSLAHSPSTIISDERTGYHSSHTEWSI